MRLVAADSDEASAYCVSQRLVVNARAAGPRLGRDVQKVIGGQVTLETEGPYPGPYVYQALHPMPEFDGNYPVVGSWLVNGYACGIGIREDSGPVTQNMSRFVPHVFTP